jgi:hypothetical protein
LITLNLDGKEYSVLIYGTPRRSLNSEFIHIDFYQPNLKEEVETEIDLEGLVKHLQLKI